MPGLPLWLLPVDLPAGALWAVHGWGPMDSSPKTTAGGWVASSTAAFLLPVLAPGAALALGASLGSPGKTIDGAAAAAAGGVAC